MGICVACFERDIAGAIGLPRAGVVQYIRPEIIGFVLGCNVFIGQFHPGFTGQPVVHNLHVCSFLGMAWPDGPLPIIPNSISNLH
ncbi:hypothetical protein [Desulfobacter vibrioformis]|uniref:hypothetical protein n=1 Tax=Desulfobacter vibrioformis TaxID=34031 RepID=UPI00247FCB30|nr:hypothetical protein [Desulfobacter vibrioformis]